MSLEQIFLSLIGILLFMSGINALQSSFLQKKKKNHFIGKVSNSTLRIQKDDKDRLIQHYYSLSVDYKDGANSKSIGLKSTKEYKVGDSIQLCTDGTTISIEEIRSNPASGAVLMIAGVLLLVATFLYKSYGVAIASIALSLCFACIAISIFLTWQKDNHLRLHKQTGVIEDILTFQKDNNQRRLFKTIEKYPLVSYKNNNSTYHYLSKNIAHGDNKVGSSVTFWADENGIYQLESKSGTPTLIIAIIMASISVWGIVSTVIQIGGIL